MDGWNRMAITVVTIFTWIIVYVITLLGQVSIDMLSINSFFIFVIIIINTIMPQPDFIH
jgi:hypothetical protein